MNMMRAAEKWLSNQHSQFLSEPVLYRRFGDGVTELSVNAVRGRTLFRAENEYGVTIRIASSDFIIPAGAIDFIPSKGDEIICGGVRYELLAPNNEPVWRWSDSGRTMLRIHAKEISE
jgi:hypothetical protein